MKKSKAEIQVDLRLASPPDDEFMRLLDEVGDEDVVAGPALGDEVRSYSADEVETIVLNGAVGSLLAHARAEADHSMRDVGTETGVTRARIGQIEQSTNIEVATLVRFAAACGYDVNIVLKPVQPGRRAFSTTLHGSAAL